MKTSFLSLSILFIAFAHQASSQQKFNQEQLLYASSERADISIGNDWYKNRWRISPQVKRDSMRIMIYGKNEQFAFKTDKDSIRFVIKRGETKSFYVKLGDAPPAHTFISASAYPWDKISYANVAQRKDVQLLFENKDHSYFDSLRSSYPIASLIDEKQSDTENVISILNWTHHQWKHDGGNTPKGGDGISILNEAKAGGRFPCFAYAIVLRDQLTAYGFPSRVLYLKTKDAEHRKSSPGHVATEVYLKDLKKWVFIDGQFNVMPMLNGKPLNAVEFQQALSQHYDQVEISSRDQVSKRGYTEFVYDYLYYLDTALDNRISAKKTIEGKRSIMLVPQGAPELVKIGFWNSVVDYCIYTNNINDFYPKMN
ncbi:transglutaminase domain-containing protein [Pedobacter frigidisoli]|uniref:transglutaminase domain-containing protein n=1 Tax=Pedobacter frigidisoli TaxID=2530455 RepID=UPI00292CEDAB|nr:transglutaminase domain-containing protein [Pedobacter frigidisoli]